jgi:hypothetical protein
MNVFKVNTQFTTEVNINYVLIHMRKTISSRNSNSTAYQMQ